MNLQAFEQKRLIPFLWVTLGWAVACVSALVFWKGYGFTELRWFGLYWLLCGLDLFALARLIARLLAYIGLEESGLRAPLAVQIGFWAFLKFLCLGLLIVALLTGKNAPGLAVILGTSTLMIVPLLGGVWWSQKELKYA